MTTSERLEIILDALDDAAKASDAMDLFSECEALSAAVCHAVVVLDELGAATGDMADRLREMADAVREGEHG